MKHEALGDQHDLDLTKETHSLQTNQDGGSIASSENPCFSRQLLEWLLLRSKEKLQQQSR